MGGKKKADGENNNNVVLKVDCNCEGCASKIKRCLRAFPGVETVKAEGDTGKITVTGNVDPTKLKEKVEEKLNKKVELISPQPKKEKEKEKEKENKDNNKQPEKEKKTDDKKPKDKEKEPPVTTAVLKVVLHCQGCIDKIRKTVSKTKGFQQMAIDKEKETVTVKGTMDVKALVGNLMEKLKRKVEVVPPKKDKENDGGGGGGNKEGSGKKKNKGGGGGGGDGDGNEEGGGKMMMQNRMEYLAPAPHPFPPFGYGNGPHHPHGYGYGGYGHGVGGNASVGGYNYVPVYPEQLHVNAPPPQMFSDENPNACSVM